MSLTLAIAVIVIADVAIVGLLALVMYLPSRLTPHSSASEARRPARLASSAVRTFKRRTRSEARSFAARS